jgi:hypothetical protein
MLKQKSLSVTLFHVIFIIGIALWLYVKLKGRALGAFFLPGLLMKAVAGIALGMVYLYYYPGGDTWGYHHDAEIIAQLAYQDKGAFLQGLFTNKYPVDLRYIHEPRALLFAKMVGVIYVFTGQSYWVSSLYLSLFSYLGMWFLANRLTETFSTSKWAAAVGFLLFPSVVFWSSGVMKESVVMGLMGFCVGLALPYIYKSKALRLWEISVVILSLIWIYFLKYYYVAILIPVLGSAVLVKLCLDKEKQIGGTSIKYMLFWSGFVMILGLVVSQVHPNLHPNYLLDVVVQNHDLTVRASVKENLVLFPGLSSSWLVMMFYFPKAFLSGIFRPGIWEAGSFFQWFTALENFVLLCFAVFALFRLGRLSGKPEAWLVYITLFYAIVLAALLTLASPNLGSLVRYRIAFFPFFVYLVMISNPLLEIVRIKLRMGNR